MDYLRGKIRGRNTQTPPETLQAVPLEYLGGGPKTPLKPFQSELPPPPSIFGRRWRESSEKNRIFWSKSTPWGRRGSEGSSTNEETSSNYDRSSSKQGSKYDIGSTYVSGSSYVAGSCYPSSSSYINESSTLRGSSYTRERSPSRPGPDVYFDLVGSSRSSSRTADSSDAAAYNSYRALDRSLRPAGSSYHRAGGSSSSREEQLCSRCSMSPPPLIEYNPIDYKALFEKEREEKMVVAQKVEELVGRQKLLELSLAKFLDLRQELSELNSEAETADLLIDSIIQRAVPDFGGKRRKTSTEENENGISDNQHRLKLFRGGRMELGIPPSPHPARNTNSPPLFYRARPALADPDIPSTPSPPPPLPLVSYEWDECSTTSSPLTSGRYTYSSRIPSRLDELKLNLRYDVSSTLLPTKLELEIKNRQGKVVFRKRQNLYYVKVQERLSTLDAAEDYVMTVTSISGNRKASEDVTIYSKEHREHSYSRSFVTPGFEVTESVTLPFSDTCRSPSDSSLTSGFDEKSIDSIFDGPLRNIEASYAEVQRAATETPVPDLEEVEMKDESPRSDSAPQEEEMLGSTPMEDPVEEDPVEEDPVEEDPVEEEDVEEEEIPEPRRNPFTLIKKPIVPQLKYRWQFGFRRTGGSTYQKVPVLKVEVKYRESTPLLPCSLEVECLNEARVLPVGPTGSTSEFVFKDGVPAPIFVFPRDKTGQDHLTAPKFRMDPACMEQCTVGQWYTEAPIIHLDI